MVQQPFFRRPLPRPILVLLLPLAALLLQWALGAWLRPYVWFMFYPAVFFSAWLGGLGGGIGSTVLSVALVWSCLLSPAPGWVGKAPGGFHAAVLFLVLGVATSLVHESLRRRLRESETRLQVLIDHASSAMAMFDRDMRYLAVSRRWMEDYHLGQQDPLGRSHYELFPEIPDAWREVHARALAGEAARAEEDRFLRQDGSVQILRWEVQPWRNARGEVAGIAIFSEDITHRVQAEEASRVTQAQLTAALDSIQDALFISDREGRFVLFNAAFASFHRFPSKADCARTFAEYPDLLDVFMANGEAAPVAQWAVPRALRGERAVAAEYGIRRKDTGEQWVGSYSFAPILDGEGAITGSVVVARDITEAKRLDAEIRSLNSSLELRVQERTAELQAANAELESFGYAVSHDLRSPLRALSGFSQALLEDLGPRLAQEERDSLDQIILASARMSDLIDGILQLSRITRGQLNRTWVDLSALAGTLCRELEQGEPGRSVVWELEAGLRAWGDPPLLAALLRNLLGNAWKFSAGAAPARIQLAGAGAPHRFKVVDNGAGFDMAYAAKLFQPFQRLHRQEEFPGMGIGLATVHRIVRRHGGTLEAQASPGRGAQFLFSLPGPDPSETQP